MSRDASDGETTRQFWTAEVLLFSTPFLSFRDGFRLQLLGRSFVAVWKQQFLRWRVRVQGLLELEMGRATDDHLITFLRKYWHSGGGHAGIDDIRLRLPSLSTSGIHRAIREGGLSAEELKVLDLRGCEGLGLDALSNQDGADLATMHRAERPPWAPPRRDEGPSLALVLAEELPAIESVDLSDCGSQLGTHQLVQDMQQSNVASVDADHRVYAIGDPVLHQLAMHRGPQLRILRFYNCYAIGDGGVSTIAASCPNLCELDLGCDLEVSSMLAPAGRRITDASVEAVCSECKQLQTLSLQGCRELRSFVSSQEEGRGEEPWDIALGRRCLRLGGIPSVTDSALHQLLRSASIHVGDVPRPGERVRWLEEPISVSHKRYLSFTSESASLEPCSLEELDLRICTALTSEGIREAFASCSTSGLHLRRVSLAFTRADDSSIVSISKSCPFLESLNLVGTSVRLSQKVREVAEAGRLSSLKELNVRCCSAVLAGAADRLRATFFKAKGFQCPFVLCHERPHIASDAQVVLSRASGSVTMHFVHAPPGSAQGATGGEGDAAVDVQLCGNVDTDRVPRESASQFVAWRALRGKSADLVVQMVGKLFPFTHVTILRRMPAGARSTPIIQRAMRQRVRSSLGAPTTMTVYVMADEEGEVVWGGG